MFKKIITKTTILSLFFTIAGNLVANPGQLTAAINYDQPFLDIPPGHIYFDDTYYLRMHGIINGYPDGTFRPEEPINRAEFLQIVILSKVTPGTFGYMKSENCFDDVPAFEWFTAAICHAKWHKIVAGYAHTNLFKPGNFINSAEALKIILNAYNLPFNASANPWYGDIMQESTKLFSFSPSPDHLITRGEVAHILHPLAYKIYGQVAGSPPEYTTNPATPEPNASTPPASTIPTVKPPSTIPTVKPPSTIPETNPYLSEKNLQTVYETRPTSAEISQILQDFKINYLDTTSGNWPPEFTFNQSSDESSKLAIISRLNVLKNQRFSEPLPFTGGLEAYDFVQKYAPTLNLDLACGAAYAGNNQIHLPYSGSTWKLVDHVEANDDGSCKNTYLTADLSPYFQQLQLLIHEASHNVPGSPPHMTCKYGWNGDATLDDGGAYANAAIYLMWVYKYGLYDPPEIKAGAHELLKTLLTDICYQPTHPNPKVQAIVDELMAENPDHSWLY